MKAETMSSQVIDGNYPLVAAAQDSPWLRSLTYDLAFLAFPWLPFLLIVVFALEWDGGFDIAQDVNNYRLIVTFLFALNFAHRNYTYVVAYSDANVFRSRKVLFTLCPLLVLPGMYVLHSFENQVIDELVLTVLALWNLWHIIMQRYGLMRGYAHRIKRGLEHRRDAHLDLSLLWCLVLFTTAIGAMLHLSMLESYPSVAQPTVDALAPVFLEHPVPIAVILGGMLATLGGWWVYNEWQHEVPLKLRLPRLSFLISNLSLMILCLVNPVLGIVAFGFSHSVEYFAYVHAVQKRKVEKRQYQGTLGNLFWRKMLLGAAVLIGLQVMIYYQNLDELLLNAVLVNTLLSGTGIIHFLYDGMIWKKSKPINTWVI
jgi:hypothetical protein